MSSNGYHHQPNILFQEPLEETEQPIIYDCITKPQNFVVLPVSEADEFGDAAQHQGTSLSATARPTIDVVKAYNPTHAYMRIISKRSISLDHHAPGWGCVYFGVILPKVQEGVFQSPKPEEAKLVAIKRLNKVVVDAELKKGKNENPFKEIQRMQKWGDNIHVLGIIEAVQDHNYLYIIMPYCERESLVEWIPWKRGIHENAARTLYRNILENMIYLHQSGICHRDLSPDNCMVLNDRIVFTDLAMSFRIPSSGYIKAGYGGFGKPAYLPPEVCMNLPFEAVTCDLWSSAKILFNLVTGEIGWTEPSPGNLLFRYLVLANGLSRTPANERTVELLMQEPSEGSELRSIAGKCLNLSPEVLDLLEGVLKVSSQERWNANQILCCAWMQQPKR